MKTKTFFLPGLTMKGWLPFSTFILTFYPFFVLFLRRIQMCMCKCLVLFKVFCYDVLIVCICFVLLSLFIVNGEARDIWNGVTHNNTAKDKVRYNNYQFVEIQIKKYWNSCRTVPPLFNSVELELNCTFYTCDTFWPHRNNHIDV